MVAPVFGFSGGDFISAVGLIVKISTALRHADGASTEIKSLIQELQQLQVVLEQLRDLPPESSPSLSYLNAIRGMALSVQIPLQDFLGKMDKYKVAVTTDSTAYRWQRAGRRVQWAVGMREEITRLRAVVTMKIVTVSILLAMPTGQLLHSIQKSCQENRRFIEDSSQSIRETNMKLSQDVLETKEEIKRVGRESAVDTQRLLRICAGLRVGVERLDGQHRIANESRQRETAVARSLQLSIWQAGIAVCELLRLFSNFSKEVIHHLRQLHLSNMELYILLRRIFENIPMSPNGLLADDIRFVDALQREWRLPYAIFCEWEIFEKMLQCKFRGFPGELKVRRGEYHIMNTKSPYQIIHRPDWSRYVFPGSSIDMSILLLALRSSGSHCPKFSCPGTGTLAAHSGMLTCSVCNLHYFPVHGEDPRQELKKTVQEVKAAANRREDISPPKLHIPKRVQPRFERIQDTSTAGSSDSSGYENAARVQKEEEWEREVEELSVFRKVHIQSETQQQQPEKIGGIEPWWQEGAREFQAWLSATKQTLFSPGMPGAGKTMIASIVVDHLFISRTIPASA